VNGFRDWNVSATRPIRFGPVGMLLDAFAMQLV
jgi:hypothetical protein